MSNSAVARACEIAGGQSRLAAQLSVTGVTVHEWVTGKRKVPPARCPEIQQCTAGAVTCEDLRPDKADYFALIRSQALATCANPATNSIAPMAQEAA